MSACCCYWVSFVIFVFCRSRHQRDRIQATWCTQLQQSASPQTMVQTGSPAFSCWLKEADLNHKQIHNKHCVKRATKSNESVVILWCQISSPAGNHSTVHLFYKNGGTVEKDNRKLWHLLRFSLQYLSNCTLKQHHITVSHIMIDLNFLITLNSIITLWTKIKTN